MLMRLRFDLRDALDRAAIEICPEKNEGQTTAYRGQHGDASFTIIKSANNLPSTNCWADISGRPPHQGTTNELLSFLIRHGIPFHVE